MLSENTCLLCGGNIHLWLSGTRACRKLGPLTYLDDRTTYRPNIQPCHPLARKVCHGWPNKDGLENLGFSQRSFSARYPPKDSLGRFIVPNARQNAPIT